MPPANSPTQAHSTPDWLIPLSPPSPSEISAIRRLQQPGPEAASARLREPEASDDIDADNVSFLRMEHEVSEGIDGRSITHTVRDEQSRRTLIGQEHDDWRNGFGQSSDTNGSTSRGSRRRPEANATPQRRTSTNPGEPTADANSREQRFQSHRQAFLRQRVDALEQSASRLQGRSQPPYGDQMPQEQSLYDWAPAGEEGNEDELEDILSELRQFQPGTHPDMIRMLGRARLDALRESRSATTTQRARPPNQPPYQHETSLRSAAICKMYAEITDCRRALGTSCNGTFWIERRDQSSESADANASADAARDAAVSLVMSEPGQHTESGASAPRNGSASSRQDSDTRSYRVTNPQRSFESRAEAQRETLESLRRQYLENPPNKASQFEEVIKSFHDAREPQWDYSHQPSLRAPVYSSEMAKFDCKDHMRDHVNSLQRDIPRLQPTSWLAPGVMFSGYQQAPWVQSSSTTLHRLASGQSAGSGSHESSRVRQHVFVPLRSPIYGGSHQEALTSPQSLEHQDRWTVKVAIHTVDYESMTIQGTMEAFNVPAIPLQPTHARLGTEEPQNNGPVHKTTFSTYLEGELIDLTTHTLLTEPSFPAPKTSPETDAAYWRRLEPFKRMTDEQIAHALLDRRWLEEELLSKYVLMRWKERCFVKPIFTAKSDAPAPGEAVRVDPSAAASNATSTFQPDAMGNGYGLSISGFYYASLRRSDGRVEGLYCDPQSSPHQQLELTVDRGTGSRGAWSLR